MGSDRDSSRVPDPEDASVSTLEKGARGILRRFEIEMEGFMIKKSPLTPL